MGWSQGVDGFFGALTLKFVAVPPTLYTSHIYVNCLVPMCMWWMRKDNFKCVWTTFLRFWSILIALIRSWLSSFKVYFYTYRPACCICCCSFEDYRVAVRSWVTGFPEHQWADWILGLNHCPIELQSTTVKHQAK